MTWQRRDQEINTQISLFFHPVMSYQCLPLDSPGLQSEARDKGNTVHTDQPPGAQSGMEKQGDLGGKTEDIQDRYIRENQGEFNMDRILNDSKELLLILLSDNGGVVI